MLRSPVANGMDVCGRARHTGRRGGERRHAWRRAIALIPTPAPVGRAETWTVVRAGRCGPKRRAKTTFVLANSPGSVMNTVTATTPARELPASIRMASRLLNTSCGQLSQLPSHLLAFRARGRKILGLRLHRRAQGIALRFRPSLVHAHLTQFSLHLLAPRLQLAESLGRGASFGGQLCAILVQFCVLSTNRNITISSSGSMKRPENRLCSGWIRSMCDLVAPVATPAAPRC